MTQKAKRGAVPATSQINSNKSAKISQEDKVLAHLRKHGSITSMTAFRLYGITRLSGRIFNLRRRGYTIITLTERSPRGEHYGRYILKEGA